MAAAEHHGRVMASELHLIVSPAASSDDAVHDAVAYLSHLENCWSRFLADSDITRINRLGSKGGGRIVVDQSTLSLVATMIAGYELTVGLFNPTLLRAVVAEGYVASHVDPQAVCVVDSVPLASAVSLRDLEIDPRSNTVVVPAGLMLDPGGVGKGLAADLAVERLVAGGAVGALVAIGGDLAMAGEAVDAEGWLVDVEWPDPVDGVACSLAISSGGVATSSVRSRRWTVDGVERHHQIDPATERCSDTDLDAVTVIAPTGWLAEVHATAALNMGSAGVIAYLEGHGLNGMAFPRDASLGSVLRTSDLADIEVRPKVSVR